MFNRLKQIKELMINLFLEKILRFIEAIGRYI